MIETQDEVADRIGEIQNELQTLIDKAQEKSPKSKAEYQDYVAAFLLSKIASLEIAFEKGDKLPSPSVAGNFKTLEECEKESIEFTKGKMKVAGGMLSEDYKTGFKEGVECYLQKHNNL
jgi:hypothetical protein|tara:strand:- start:753 stop:1109 length:357 start_codon:yes stop_codon:yes gene_type:complete